MTKKPIVLFTAILFLCTTIVLVEAAVPQIRAKTGQKVTAKKNKLYLIIPTAVKAKNMIGAIGDTVPIKGKLTLMSKGTPIANQELRFYVGGKLIGKAKTNSKGDAKVMYMVPNKMGAKPIKVVFLGAGKLLKSEDKASFGVVKSSTRISGEWGLNANSKAKPGTVIEIRGKLYRITDKKGLDGRELIVYANGKEIKKIGTSSNGKYGFYYTIPKSAKGTLTFKIHFHGDTLYIPSAKKLSRKIYPPLKNAFLLWQDATGLVGQSLTVKATFRTSPMYMPSFGIGGKKVVLLARRGDSNKTVGTAYTNSKGVARVKFKIELDYGTHALWAFVDGVKDEYRVIKIPKNGRVIKVIKSPVKISVMGSTTGKIGDTLLFSVIVRRTTDNNGAEGVMVHFGNLKKKTSHLGSAGFFYKIPYQGGTGLRHIPVKSDSSKKYRAGSTTKPITVKPKDN